jgi:3-deoxy-D-manno-octulosonate 8-phosphate phosphatase (KDO 8-P phosphatase)
LAANPILRKISDDQMAAPEHPLELVPPKSSIYSDNSCLQEIRHRRLENGAPYMSDIDLAYLASPDALARARKIKLFLMDVDGTLTDGGVCLISSTVADASGKAAVTEMKVFNAQDGQGLSLAHTMGILTGFITGRRSPAVAKRAEELHVPFVYLGQASKTAAFEECLQKAGVTEEEVAYLGDDLPDIPLAQRAGLAVCVADGAPELAAVCHFKTRRPGGRGAAREVVELILKAQGRWEEAVPRALA